VLHKSAPHECNTKVKNQNSHPASIGFLIIRGIRGDASALLMRLHGNPGSGFWGSGKNEGKPGRDPAWRPY